MNAVLISPDRALALFQQDADRTDLMMPEQGKPATSANPIAQISEAHDGIDIKLMNRNVVVWVNHMSYHKPMVYQLPEGVSWESEGYENSLV